MKSELILLIEKFFSQQASAEEIIRLRESFSQAETEDFLSSFYEEKWKSAFLGSEIEVEERIWTNLHEKVRTKHNSAKSPLWKKGLRVAASILIPLFCIWIGFLFSENKSNKNGNNKLTVHVAVGQKVDIQLSDSTHIWLNSASSLTYDNFTYNLNERVVYLKGEAYFEVQKDKTRPFIVKVDDISVEALGTSFNVKAYPDDNYVTATLIEGSVRISSMSQSEVLEVNEKLIINKNSGNFDKSVLLDVDKNISWINSQLAFEHERLEDVVKILERMYSIKIYFASEPLKDIRFSGTIKNNNLENVLQLITFVSPIIYSLENDTTIIIKSKYPY